MRTVSRDKLKHSFGTLARETQDIASSVMICEEEKRRSTGGAKRMNSDWGINHDKRDCRTKWVD